MLDHGGEGKDCICVWVLVVVMEVEEEQEEEIVFVSCYVAQVGSESKAFLFSLLTARVVGLYHTY